MFRLSLREDVRDSILRVRDSIPSDEEIISRRGMALRVARVEREACTDRIVIDFCAARRRQVERPNVCKDGIRLAEMPEFTQLVPPFIHDLDR
jgi:hypothetical protein